MINVKTPLEAFQYWMEVDPHHTFLRQPINRKFIEYTRKQAYEEARRIAAELHGMGLQQGDHVALLSKNCAHWFMADLALMMGGFVSIPLYPTLDPESIREILIHSESKAILIGKLDDYEYQKQGIPKIPIIGVKLYGVAEHYSWESIVQNDHVAFDPCPQTPDKVFTIMYTSGTTGNPKGVMHTAASFNHVTSIGAEALEIPEKVRLFSYLPLAHIAERIAVEMASFYRGGIVCFAESLDTFAEDLVHASPDLFLAVPRIWQKFQEKIIEKLPQKKLDILLALPIIGSLIKKKIRKKLGLNTTKVFLSGAAPIAASLQKWYARLGIQIQQCYGMTEDCVLSHFNLRKSNRFGTVGKALPCVHSKLSAEGEILIKNDCLMKGYYKSPDQTAAMFTQDGYLRTGDLGEFDHDGFLSIIGRIKDQFKTDKGKYVTPSLIELQLSKNSDIEQVCVVGTGIAQPIALIIPSQAGKDKGREQLNESLLETLDTINPTLQKHEKLAKAVVMKEEWSVDNGLMTPSMKIRRNRIEEIHQPMYSHWFNLEDRVVYEVDDQLL